MPDDNLRQFMIILCKAMLGWLQAPGDPSAERRALVRIGKYIAGRYDLR